MIKKIQNLFQDAKRRRTNFDNAWTDISIWFRPNRGDFNNKDSEGSLRDQRKVHAAPPLAVKKLASKITTSLTDLTVNKFKIVPVTEEAQDDEEIRKLASDNTFNMRNILQHPHLNFATSNQNFTEDWCAFGTAVMELKEVDHFPFMATKAVHLNDIYILENHLGMVDVVFHKLEVTGRQLLQQFDSSVLPENILKQATKDPAEKICIYKVAMSSEDAKTFLDIKGLSKHVVAYMDEDLSAVFKEVHLDYFPYLVSRYSVATDELYGRSPAWDGLPYARRISALQIPYANSLIRSLVPTVITSDDSVLPKGLMKPGQRIDGGIDFSTGQRTIDYLQYPTNLQAGREEEQWLIDKINELFLVQGLPDNKNVRMTQVEVQARLAELQSLAPNVSRLVIEYINPLLTTLYRFWVKKGLLKKKPKELNNIPLEFNLSGALANVHRFAEIESVQTMYNLISVIGAINPQVAALPKHEEILRLVADILNVPDKVIKSNSELQQEATQAAEAQQQAQSLQAAQGLSEAGLNAARAAEIQGGV